MVRIICVICVHISDILAAGTAILSKVAPLSVSYNLPAYDNPAVVKGRIITLEYPGCWVVGTYVPNAGQNLKVCFIIILREVQRHDKRARR